MSLLVVPGSKGTVSTKDDVRLYQPLVTGDIRRRQESGAWKA